MIPFSLRCDCCSGGCKMRYIIKTTPPHEFIEYCDTPGVSYDNLSGVPKIALRQRLLEDQGYICCYCGRRIENDKHTKIEHIKCQERNNELALCFENMLASCDGGEQDRENRVRPKHKVHCDAKKGNDDIPVSPLDEHIEEYLMFFDDGTVKAKDSVGEALIRVLGLNAKFLINQRKSALANYSVLPVDNWDLELERLKNRGSDGKYEEFCFVLQSYAEMFVDSEVNAKLAV